MNRYIVNVIFSQIIMSSLFASTLPAQNDLDAQERALDRQIKILENASANMKRIFSDPNLTQAYYDRLIKELEAVNALMNPKSKYPDEQLAALTELEQQMVARASQYGIQLNGEQTTPTSTLTQKPVQAPSIHAPAIQLPALTPTIMQHDLLPSVAPNEPNILMHQPQIAQQMPLAPQEYVHQQNGNAPYPLNMHSQQYDAPMYNSDPQNYYNNPQNGNMQTDWGQQQSPMMIQGNNEVNQGYNGMYQQGNQYQNLLNAPTDVDAYLPTNNASVNSQQPQQPNYWSPSEESSPQLLTTPRTPTSTNKRKTDSEVDSNTVTTNILRSMNGRAGNDNSAESLMDLKRQARGTNPSNMTLGDLNKRGR
ncbi:MAG: hypothetical protein CNLJKLNK_01361 [Holosporales bacterium]